jgi:hypothetical protein
MNERAAKQSGKYHMRCYIRQETDAKQNKRMQSLATLG